MASAGLLHPQVHVDMDAVENRISNGGYQPDANDQPQPLQTVLIITSPLSDVWPEPPPDRHLHIFVRLPHRAGESLFFLLVLGPFGNALSLFSPPDYDLA